MPAAKKTTVAVKTAKSVKAAAPKATKAPAKTATKATTKMTAEQKAKIKARNEKSQKLQDGYNPVKEVYGRNDLIAIISDQLEMDKRQVGKVYDAIVDTALASLMPKGVGEFTFPGLVKLTAKKVPAKKGGKMVKSPFSGEMVMTKPKPATVRIQARPLAKAKMIALPQLKV